MTSITPRRKQAPYRFLFLGRWHVNKGIDLLLDALKLLSEEDWSKIEEFEIQGGGPLVNLVRERVNQLVVDGRPLKLGTFLSKVEAENAIKRSDWVVIPSRIESIPVVFSDAIKMNRPVVATPVGDLPRLLSDFACGILSTSTSPADIAEALRKATLEKGFSDISPGLVDIFALPKIAQRIVEDFGNSAH